MSIRDRISAISNSKGIPGTGCLAYLRSSGEPVVLSNWHVLYGKGAVKNDTVWRVEQNEEQQRLREMGKIVSGKIGNIWFHNWEVYVDCAISTYIKSNNLFSVGNTGSSIPVVEGHGEACVGDPVFKIGAGTGMTKGIVVNNRHADHAFIEGGTTLAKDQLLIRSEDGSPFSAKGDSGSVILNKDHKVVGLLWGTNSWGEGLACPIEPVMAVLGIDFGASKI